MSNVVTDAQALEVLPPALARIGWQGNFPAVSREGRKNRPYYLFSACLPLQSQRRSKINRKLHFPSQTCSEGSVKQHSSPNRLPVGQRVLPRVAGGEGSFGFLVLLSLSSVSVVSKLFIMVNF